MSACEAAICSTLRSCCGQQTAWSSHQLQSESSSLCCWSLCWWGSRRCRPRGTERERGEAAARPERPAGKTLTWASTTGWNTKHQRQELANGRKDIHERSSFLLFTARTRGSASSPGCRLRTGGDLYERGTDTLHGDKGSSDSSSCWTRCQAPQTWTFPNNTREVHDWQCSTRKKSHLCVSCPFVPQFWRSVVQNNYLQNGVYELQRHRELLVAELLVRIVFHGYKEEKIYIFEIIKLQPVHAKSS